MTLSSRRALHLQVTAVLRERKRLRAQRAEINESLELARLRVAQQGPSDGVRAADQKDPAKGWLIVSEESGSVVEYASSRDKARARAKEINQTPAMTIESAMNDLGYLKLTEQGRTPEKQWTRTIDV